MVANSSGLENNQSRKLSVGAAKKRPAISNISNHTIVSARNSISHSSKLGPGPLQSMNTRPMVKVLYSWKVVSVRRLVKLQSTPPIKSDEVACSLDNNFSCLNISKEKQQTNSFIQKERVSTYSQELTKRSLQGTWSQQDCDVKGRQDSCQKSCHF